MLYQLLLIIVIIIIIIVLAALFRQNQSFCLLLDIKEQVSIYTSKQTKNLQNI